MSATRMIRDADGNRVRGYKEWCGGTGREPLPAHLYRFPSDNPRMRKYDRGFCHLCCKLVKLRADGTMRAHGRYVA